jgi:hypothetical protein
LPSKRRRTTTIPLSLASLQQLDAAESCASEQNRPVHVTITNNNRRSDKAITRKVAAAKQQKKKSLGLEELAQAAPQREWIAYNSIPQKEEPVVAWIIKQSINDELFLFSNPTPYATACSMIEKASLIGNSTS